MTLLPPPHNVTKNLNRRSAEAAAGEITEIPLRVWYMCDIYLKEEEEEQICQAQSWERRESSCGLERKRSFRRYASCNNAVTFDAFVVCNKCILKTSERILKNLESIFGSWWAVTGFRKTPTQEIQIMKIWGGRDGIYGYGMCH